MSPSENPILASMLQTLGQLGEKIEQINTHVQDSHDALRGKGTEPGLVAMTTELREKVDGLSASVKADRTDIESIKQRLAELEKYQKDYPSLTWLMHHKTKTVLAWAAAGMTILVLISSPVLNPRMSVAVLKALHIPEPIIEYYLGVP